MNINKYLLTVLLCAVAISADAQDTQGNEADAAIDAILADTPAPEKADASPAPSPTPAPSDSSADAAPNKDANDAVDAILADSPAETNTAASPDASNSSADASDTPAELATIPLEKKSPETAVPPPHRGVQLEEIVVTATKRAADMRTIPSTLSVLTGEDLEQKGVQGLEQIVTQVPGVSMNNNEGGGDPKRISIRGVASSPATNFTVGTLFGDVPFSDPFAPKVQLDPNPFDIATVEVLKGPQGTLFGGTGLNGMVRYVPQAPEFDAVHIKYFTQYDSYPGNGGSGFSYGGAINTPFADNTAAVRIMGFHRDAPGYVDDLQSGKKDVNSSKQYGFRGAVAWRPNDDWKISLLGMTQRTSINDLGITDNFNGQLSRGNTPRQSPGKNHYSLANLGIEHEFSWATFVSQTSYFKKGVESFIDGSRIALDGQVPLLGAATFNKSSGYSQEFRLVSPDDGSKWKWIAGAFLYKLNYYDCSEVTAAEISVLPILNLPTSLQGILASPCPQNASKLAGQLDIAQLIGDIGIKETALFGEVTRELTEDFDFTAGARVYRTSSSGTVTTAGGLYSLQNNGAVSQRDAGSSEPGISPKASLVYHPTEDLRGYFTAARGFRFGGPQLGASTPTTPVPTSYKSDSIWSYELGLRSDWLDQTLRIDASAYHLTWKDPQVRQASSDNLAVYIDNVGGVSGNGVDLSVQYLLPYIPGLALNSAVSWNRTVTTKAFKDATGVDVPSGSPWPQAPRWQTSTTLAYALPLESWNSSISLRHTYWAKACNDIACGADVFGFRTLDLNLFVASAEHLWWPELSVGLQNLTDERGVSNVILTNLNGVLKNNTVNYITPRAVMVRLSGKF